MRSSLKKASMKDSFIFRNNVNMNNSIRKSIDESEDENYKFDKDDNITFSVLHISPRLKQEVIKEVYKHKGYINNDLMKVAQEKANNIRFNIKGNHKDQDTNDDKIDPFETDKLIK